jgi:hypothetical protein
MKRYSHLVLLLFIGLTVWLAGCKSQPTANTPPPESTATPAKPPATPPTPFERDLQFIRNGQFTYVLVVSRKDGKPLDAEDGAFLRKNAHQVVDWAMSDPKRAVGGTNFQFTREQMDLLETRFKVENYSN